MVGVRRGVVAFLIALLAVPAMQAVRLAPSAKAAHTPAPLSVTIPGSFQSEIGCSGDWQADCAATHLSYDANEADSNQVTAT